MVECFEEVFMRVIWFNHWFSTAYHFIKSLTEDERNYVIASNKRSDCVYKIAVHKFFIEPEDVSGEEYVNWCLNFCKENAVDVFFVRREMESIVKFADKFANMGVKLIADLNADLQRLLSSKYDSTTYIANKNLCHTPLVFRVSTAEEFLEAYDKLKGKYGSDKYLCIKDDTDEGGGTYKRIADENTPYNRYDVSKEDAIELFKNNAAPKILMPYMDGPEVSIDCIQMGSGDGLIAIPRLKLGSRFTEIRFDADLLSIAKRISNIINIEYPYNIQLRKIDGEYAFMEINLRMAGGSFKDMAVGCSFAQLAVNYAYGDHVDLKKIRQGFNNKLIGNIENYVVL